MTVAVDHLERGKLAVGLSVAMWVQLRRARGDGHTLQRSSTGGVQTAKCLRQGIFSGCFSILIFFLFLRTLPAGGSNVWQFTETSKTAGIDLVVIAGSPEKRQLVETMTGGVCVLDYDKDGWQDLFFVNGTTREFWGKRGGPTDRLFRNRGDGTFADVTEKAGVRDSGWGMGCVAADFDNDGDTDLYVTNFGSNYLYANDGDGTFTEIGRRAGVDDPRWSTGAAFGDYDRDGDLDLYVTNYVHFTFDGPAPDPQFCSYRGVTVACGPKGLPGAPDVLFRNNGDGTFTDVSQKAGIDDSKNLYGFQAVWTDFDLDGDQDIFVANDSTPNYLWQNNGNGTFTDVALVTAVAYNQDGHEQANMGVDLADYDQDGNLDIYSTNFSGEYNVLYRYLGQSLFQDVTLSTRLRETTVPLLGFGTLFADLDNDAWPDLFVANGHVYPEVDRFRLGSDYRQRNQVFSNLRDGTFREIGPSLGEGLAIVKSSRGAALLDWDRDGDLDIAVSNLDDPVDLLRNDLPAGPNYLQVDLRGHESNRDGVGARITIACANSRQMQELRAGSSYLSNSQRIIHFGLGKDSIVETVEIVWPSGRKQTLENIRANQKILVDEERGLIEGLWE